MFALICSKKIKIYKDCCDKKLLSTNIQSDYQHDHTRSNMLHYITTWKKIPRMCQFSWLSASVGVLVFLGSVHRGKDALRHN